MIHELIYILLHLDTQLQTLVTQYGIWIFVALFLIIFCETGLVVTPILPGDSMLFAIGMLSMPHLFEFTLLLILAAILGNTTNYWIGRWVRHKIIEQKEHRFIKLDYLKQGHAFYEKHGAAAIIFSRFIPIIRTMVPFIAGVSTMNHRHYQALNIVSAILWVGGIVALGHTFGNIPVVKQNFNSVILTIIVLSLLPGLIKLWQKLRKTR